MKRRCINGHEIMLDTSHCRYFEEEASALSFSSFIDCPICGARMGWVSKKEEG